MSHILDRLWPWRRGAGEEQPRYTGLSYEAVEKVLALYTAGLTDGRLSLRRTPPGEPASTDTRHIFLPPQLAEFPTDADNFHLYKLTIAHKHMLVEECSLERPGFLEGCPNRELAEEVYALVENHRVEALLVRRFRGLARFLRIARADAWAKRLALRGLGLRMAAAEALLQLELRGETREALRPELSRTVEECYRMIEKVEGEDREASLAVAAEVYAALAELRGNHQRLPPVHYRGVIRWDRVAWVTREVREAQQSRRSPTPEEVTPGENRLTGQPLVVDVRRPLATAAEGRLESGPRSQVSVSFADHESSPAGNEVDLRQEDRQGAVLYDEWDYRQDAYREGWCALHERQVRPTSERYVEEVLARHHGLLTRLKRQFEALRPERRRLRKQPDGEDVDIDAVVESYVDRRARLSPSEKLYVARRETRRDIAVGFLVDLSGSTGGWLGERRIIDVEKEALILMGEALSVLDDKYAIFGFSGSTRRQCDFYKIKEFAEPMSPPVRARISGLDTFAYTRMGTPIRHLAAILSGVDAKVRLLLLLSDGRPNDFDAYGGTYGIEDTRRALLECRQRGIRTFCLTIDSRAREYLPHLFGPTQYTILDNVDLLPERLPELYRRLTGLGS